MGFLEEKEVAVTVSAPLKLPQPQVADQVDLVMQALTRLPGLSISSLHFFVEFCQDIRRFLK